MNYFELIHLTNPPTESNTKEYWDCKGNKITKKEFDQLKQNKENTYNN